MNRGKGAAAVTSSSSSLHTSMDECSSQIIQKKHNDPVLPNLGESEKMQESGFIIPQEIPADSWLKRGFGAAPNRYGIKPGRHWDGVDRSNGFEKEVFKKTNTEQASEREAYRWSVSDM